MTEKYWPMVVFVILAAVALEFITIVEEFQKTPTSPHSSAANSI